MEQSNGCALAFDAVLFVVDLFGLRLEIVDAVGTVLIELVPNFLDQAMLKRLFSLKRAKSLLGVTESPITGAEGNKEFLIAAVLEA